MNIQVHLKWHWVGVYVGAAEEDYFWQQQKENHAGSSEASHHHCLELPEKEFLILRN